MPISLVGGTAVREIKPCRHKTFVSHGIRFEESALPNTPRVRDAFELAKADAYDRFDDPRRSRQLFPRSHNWGRHASSGRLVGIYVLAAIHDDSLGLEAFGIAPMESYDSSLRCFRAIARQATWRSSFAPHG